MASIKPTDYFSFERIASHAVAKIPSQLKKNKNNCPVIVLFLQQPSSLELPHSEKVS